MPVTRPKPPAHTLELWAGAECTVNRIGDTYRDQLMLTGHHDRIEDFDRIAELGIAAFRFPVLWERVSPGRSEESDWSWTDERIARLRRAGIRPIVGLVHHGSGPRHTSLIDRGFAPGLAEHALATASRYPWVRDWTPVNEPLTTARFAALYGVWYPHLCEERAFWQALLNQVEATCLAMRAIRSVNPAARLIQTEDLGRTYATASLADQAAFDNGRRWLTWDLLAGHVTPRHDFWTRLCAQGFEDRLRSLMDDPCPPDVIGVNHYLTSDRFLDHRVQHYPPQVRGGNGQSAFADVEAVRALHPPLQGLRGALMEAWERYGLPLALTEVHNGCTREEQLRWMEEAWQTAMDLRSQHVDVRAVTAWALFGSQDWNRLLTGPGIYESGAFDVSGDRPRRTALAQQLQALARGEPRPAARRGWWRRDIRTGVPVVHRPAPVRDHIAAEAPEAAPQLLILGATGTLGQALAGACRHRNIPFVLTRRGDLDLHDPDGIARALDLHRPARVINAAGWVRVDEAEVQPDACLAANARGAIDLARACRQRGIATVSFSSDLVFDGRTAVAYVEADAPAPLNVYGRSKRLMEYGILALNGDDLVVRTAAFFSPFDAHNFAMAVVRTLRGGSAFAAASDRVVSPTYVPDLCNAVLDLAIDGEKGIWHTTNGEAVSWSDFARRIARACALDESLIEERAAEELCWAAARPERCALRNTRGSALPSLESAISRFADHIWR